MFTTNQTSTIRHQVSMKVSLKLKNANVDAIEAMANPYHFA